MNASSRFRSLAVVLLALLALAAVASPASASHSWNNYHWARTSNPFTLKVGNNVKITWAAQFNTSVTDWNSSSVMDLTDVAGTSNKRCSAVAGTVQVCNGTYGNNGWLGLASIWLSGGHITQGTAKMNDTYFNTSTYNNPNEKLHVMCQEIGHTFGLGHTSEDGSSQNTCMDYFSNTGANAGSTLSTRPNQHDYDMLASIYAHLDSSTTIGALPADAANARLDTPADWGKEVHAEGRASIYMREFASGHKIITFVYWVEGRGANQH